MSTPNLSNSATSTIKLCRKVHCPTLKGNEKSQFSWMVLALSHSGFWLACGVSVCWDRACRVRGDASSGCFRISPCLSPPSSVAKAICAYQSIGKLRLFLTPTLSHLYDGARMSTEKSVKVRPFEAAESPALRGKNDLKVTFQTRRIEMVRCSFTLAFACPDNPPCQL